MATTNDRHISQESDGVYITMQQDCEFGHTGDSMWISASTARMLIAQGKAVESDPAPKQ
jgi:hypothetical protein